jgi:Ca2+-transporting ATPase
MTILLLATFFILLPLGLDVARTTLFTGFILFEFMRIGVIRQGEKLSFFVNKWMVLAVVISMLLQLLIIYTPISVYFHVVPLGLLPWVVLLGVLVVSWMVGIGITNLIGKFIPG